MVVFFQTCRDFIKLFDFKSTNVLYMLNIVCKINKYLEKVRDCSLRNFRIKSGFL